MEVLAQGWGKRSKSSTLIVLYASFSVCIRTVTYHKTFKLEPLVRWRIKFYSVASDTRVHVRGDNLGR